MRAITTLPAQHHKGHRPAPVPRRPDGKAKRADIGRDAAVRFAAPYVSVPRHPTLPGWAEGRALRPATSGPAP